jgi:glycosyltransferase involved in cell wall biosynthesis
MSAGVVVIASPHGGAAEALEEGVTGFVRDPYRPDQWVDLIQGLLATPKKVTSLRKAAAVAARIQFDVKRTARELLVCLLDAFDKNFIQPPKNSAK